MAVPESPGVYLLGCLERRVTLLSQQVRALNLIYSLFTEGRVNAGDDIAVVGGGAAGLTAAAAAAICGCQVTLLEKGNLLGLIANCDKRWVHPHVYDWPAPGSLKAHADELEVMTWHADTAASVAKQLIAGFRAVQDRHSGRLRDHVGVRNVQLVQGGLRWSPGDNKHKYKAIVLAVGFGLEQTVAPFPLHSYWRDDSLDQDELIPGRRYLISGTGDGGLTDLLRACISRFRHHEMVRDFGLEGDAPEFQALAQQLNAIEHDARRNDHPAEFLNARYKQIEAGWVDAKLEQRLKFPRGGSGASVVLNGSDADPLDLHASILNRFIVSRLLRMEAVDYRYGKIKEIQPEASGRHRVVFEDLSSDVFDQIVIRHGAESALQAGFPALAKKCAALRAKNELDQTRTPIWTPGWFRDRWSMPIAGASTHAKEEPGPALSEPKEAPAGHLNQNPNSVMDSSPEKPKDQSPGAIYSVNNCVFHVPYAPKGNQMVGRAGLLDRIRTQLRQIKRTHIGQAASFQGIGGLGKTQTAVEYAHRYKDEYPGGVIWLFADQDIDAQLTQLAVDARWVADQSEHSIKLDIARQRLRTHPNCLLIFDNLEDVKRIEPYLPAPSLDVHILVTSRLEQLGFEPIPIDPLFPEEALNLLLLEADRQGVEGAGLVAAKGIVEQLDGLPLALELAGAYLRHRPSISWQEYLELLQDEGLRKALPGKFLASGTRHEADLFVTLRLSEQLLQEEPRLKEILAVMAELAPSSVGTALLATLLGEDKPIRLADALSLGVKLRILRLEEGEPGQRRYRMHRLVWAVLREERCFDSSPRREVGKRLMNWLMALRDDPAKLGSYEAELAHLREWEKNALGNGWNDDQVRCLWLQGYPPYHRGQYRQAYEWVKRALDLYRNRAVHDEQLLGNLLNDCSTSLAASGGGLAESHGLGLEALELRRRSLGEEHPDTATSWNNVGSTYGEMGQQPTALEYKEKALAIRRRVLGEEHPDTASSWNNVGSTYGTMGQYPKALEYVEKALAIQRRVLGEEHPDTATSWNNVGSTYGAMGQHPKALEYVEKALAIRHRVLGEEHPATASSWDNVGSAYGEMGQHPKALEYKEKALAIRRRVLGEEHPATASSWNNVGSTYGEMGQHPKALEYKEKALAIWRAVLGEEHPDTASSWDNVGSTYGEMGQYPKALEYKEKALAIERQVLGEENPDTATSWNNVGITYGEMGQYPKALEYMEKALAIQRRVLGEENPATATSWNNVGSTYGEMGQHSKALEYMEKALVIRRRVLGEEHPATATSWNNVGSLYGDMGQHPKALDYQQKALAIWCRVLGEEHPATATSWNNVGITYGKIGQHPKALEYKEKALAIRRRVLGEEHPATASSWNNVGYTYGEMGQHSKALEYMEKALLIWRGALGQEHPTTINAVLTYASLLWNTNKTYKARDVLEKALGRIEKGSAAYKKLNDAKRTMILPGDRVSQNAKRNNLNFPSQEIYAGVVTGLSTCESFYAAGWEVVRGRTRRCDSRAGEQGAAYALTRPAEISLSSKRGEWPAARGNPPETVPRSSDRAAVDCSPCPGRTAPAR